MRNENIEFLEWVATTQAAPYEVSFSSLVDLAVSIWRALVISGDIALNPAALQVLLRHKSLPRVSAAVNGPGLNPTRDSVATQARFSFFSRLDRRVAAVVELGASIVSFPGFGPTVCADSITGRAA